MDGGIIKAILTKAKSGRLQNQPLNQESLAQFEAIVGQVNNCLKAQGQFDRLPR